MNVKIEETHNGWIVMYDGSSDIKGQYVYKSTEDLLMLKEIARKFLKRRLKIEAE